MFKYIYILIVTSVVYSQKNDFFVDNLNRINGVFNVPDGYKLENSNIEYTWCWDNKDEGGIFRTLSNVDGSILIGVIINSPDTKMINTARRYNPNWTADTGYFNRFRNLADTINNSVRYYGKSYVNDTLNANMAVEFSRGCTRSYREKYTHNKIVLIGKKGVGHFQIDFLYTDAVEKTIHYEIQRILPMLVKFNN
ncbi:hypothetical protein [Flavobacterium daejeonense]|uniref:hypothetical protein n=1 Tax=Flavobacterium daejeonense TaxID=350893 RepID=UPI00047BA67C|nr:hypothetical protein [Flavobacterium daejeonense]